MLAATQKMNEHGVGVLVVINDEGRLVGIFTERDVLGLISIGDLNAYHTNHQTVTIHFLHEYMHGRT